MVILSALEPTNLDDSITCTSRWFILAQRMQNVEYVNVKCVACTQPIWVPLNLDKLNLVFKIDFKVLSNWPPVYI